MKQADYVNPSGDREKPEVVAPGVNITGIGLNGNLATLSGTSLAAPHVSAVAGLIVDRFPYFNNLFVSTILKTSAERLGNHPHFGSGMVNAYHAVGGR